MIIANVEDYRKQCEARLPHFLYDYISGGSYQENRGVPVNNDWHNTMLKGRRLQLGQRGSSKSG
jgi:hypothetical protein